MALDRSYYVYILSSETRTLYVGVTNDLARRVAEHKSRARPGFAARYNATHLVWFEETNDVQAAIEREKQVKSLRREKKIALIEAMNPDWRDLSDDWEVW